jgi:UDP-glucose 4-epimerase
MEKKILITGGAGYIGSKVSYDLTDLGFKVYILDNLSTGHRKLINKKALFYHGDILDYKFINDLLKKNRINTIIHLAASLSVMESQINPLKYYKNNVEGTENLLRAAVNNNLKYFVFSSTCAIYGNTNKRKIDENNFPRPVSYYGKTKFLSELVLKNYAQKYKFSYAILRYFNVVGSDEKLRTGLINDNDQLFKNISSKILKTEKISVNINGKDYATKDGTCIRDYIAVNDLSKCHISSLKYISQKKKSIILNCGYGKGFSVLDIVNIFSKVVKKKIKIIFKKRRNGDIESVVCDTKLQQKLFGKVHKTSLQNIVKSTLEWERTLYKKISNNEI